MTKTFLKSVDIGDFNKPNINPKTNHEAISSYIIANYLFTNLNERINFFKDINKLFEYNLNIYTRQFYTSNIRTKTALEVESLLKGNIKLVYKGGNMINYYLKIFKNIWEKIDVDIKADTLSDFDFSILINYDYILEKLTLAKSDENYIKLNRIADLIAFNIIKHFNNHMFCYNSDILKDSYINETVKFPSKVYYKFADIDQAKIMEIFTYVNDYFSNILKIPVNPNFYPFLSANIDKINNRELNHDLKLQFDIIAQCANTSLSFIGFSLPTTFNKHKKIFKELELINDDNSTKLKTFVNHLINNITPTSPDTLSTDNTLINKININSKLIKLNERYDRIKTTLIEVYPSNDAGDYCNLLPTKIAELFQNQIKKSDNLLTKYYERTNALNFNNFYHIDSDKLTLYENIGYNKFVKNSDFNLENYTKIYLNEYFNTYENMVSVSSNYSLLFGTTNRDGNWSKITNFNLERGKVPVRYFLKLETPYLIKGNLIKYIFFDYLGELIDISIPTYGDSYFREHFISKNLVDNIEFTDKLNQIEITGNPTSNKVDILTYSLEYFIFDLYEVIFESEEGKPWTIPKYEKRIGRIAKTYLSYLKDKYNVTDGLEMYYSFICHIEKAIEQFKQTNNIDIDIYLIIELLDDIFKDFLNRLDKLSKNILPTDREQMIQFLDLLICYLKPNIDCIGKIKIVENIKPFNFLSEPLTSHYLSKI